VAHHGSNDSSTAAFLAVADPKLAVISVGADNTFGHPGADTLQRLADVVGANNIYRTDKNGICGMHHGRDEAVGEDGEVRMGISSK